MAKKRILPRSGISWYVACVAAVFLTHGCGPNQNGPPRAPIEGQVSLIGEPVANGNISFIPIRDAKGPVVAAKIEGGEYQLPKAKGPVVGWNRVEIRWSRPTGRQIEAGPPSAPGTMIDEITEAIPVQFNSQSTLEREILAENNSLDFDLPAE